MSQMLHVQSLIGGSLGSFAAALARAWQLGGSDSRARLVQAFPHLLTVPATVTDSLNALDAVLPCYTITVELSPPLDKDEIRTLRHHLQLGYDAGVAGHFMVHPEKADFNRSMADDRDVLEHNLKRGLLKPGPAHVTTRAQLAGELEELCDPSLPHPLVQRVIDALRAV